MRAVGIGSPASLVSIEVHDKSIPRPNADQIVLRVEASSLNFHDYLVVTGAIPQPKGRIPLSDGAGIVAAVGSSVSGLKVGDRVMGLFFPHWLTGEPSRETTDAISGENIDGFAADYVCLSSSAVTPIPTGYSSLEAAALPCAAVTAWRALIDTSKLKAGDTLLVQGSGGVSLFALQIAKEVGARVIATSSSDDKLERMRAMGADHLINYRRTPKWAEAARAATNGKGVDVVLDVGGSDTLPQSIVACRMGGRVVMLGVLSGVTMTMSIPAIVMNHVNLSGIAVGNRAHQLDLVSFITRTDIRPVIDTSFSLEQLGEAFRYQESNNHFGKIGISMI